MYIDKERRNELIKQFLQTKDKINQFKNNKVRLIKFEVFDSRGWLDYSHVHPSLNKIKIFLEMSRENIAFQELTGEIIKLNISSRVNDIIELCGEHNNYIIITFDDRIRARAYKGQGMRFTYEIIS